MRISHDMHLIHSHQLLQMAKCELQAASGGKAKWKTETQMKSAHISNDSKQETRYASSFKQMKAENVKQSAVLHINYENCLDL